MSDEEMYKLAMIAGLIERLDLTRFDWLPALREFAELAQSAELERCAKYLRDSAERLAPEVKRINQIDRHVANVLACKGYELAKGYGCGELSDREKK